MSFSIEDLMGTPDRDAFHDDMAGLIRSNRHHEAEIILASLLAAVLSEAARLCLARSVEDVVVTGWQEFNTQIEVISAGGKPVTAVGIDITDQGDGEDAQGRREQLLESNCYTDECGFEFSRASREDILAEIVKPGTPPWVGSFAGIDGSLSVRGLAPLYDILLRLPGAVNTQPAFSYRCANDVTW